MNENGTNWNSENLKIDWNLVTKIVYYTLAKVITQTTTEFKDYTSVTTILIRLQWS